MQFLDKSSIFMNRSTATCDPDRDTQRPSKTQRKNASHALQDLGEQLATLAPERLLALGLPEDVGGAIVEAQRIRSHEGRRRQMQLVGKLMRGLDGATLQRLRDGFDHETQQSREDSARLHELERWRERLLEDDGAVTAWMAHHPTTDAQQLRALIRAARKERTDTRPPRAFREVFRFLKAVSAPDAGAAPLEEDPS